MENMRKALLAQGIDAAMVDSLLKSFKLKKAKEAKTKNAFFGAMKASTKVDLDVTVTTICSCCGSRVERVIIIKAAKDSPTTQRVATSVCSECPDFVRQFSHEELVTMLLLGEKSQQELRFASVKFRAMLAKKLSPEGVISFTSLAAMKREEAQDAQNTTDRT